MARKSGKGGTKGGGAGKTRQYVRDNSGRFASSPGGGKKAAAKPAAKPAAKTPAKPKAPPKTSTARGRARTKAAEARKALKAGGGTRAARSLLTAQRAADYYKATGTGTKRSKAKGSGGSKPAKEVAGRPRAGAKPARRLSGMGRAPATRLPAANSDAYKYNKAGLLASPQERLRMRGRDRAREKNAALAQQQAAGQRRAERQAARRLTSDRTQPMSVLRNSPTFNAAERAVQRRSRRADENFRQSFQLERQKSALTSKALKMQQQAAERKAQGKKVTQTMESNFQQLRRQLAKIDRSLATRRRALDVVRGQSDRMTINTRERSRY